MNQSESSKAFSNMQNHSDFAHQNSSLPIEAKSNSLSHRQRDATNSRRSGPHLNPFLGRNSNSGESNDGINSSARLIRQQFRKRCQEAMARDRQRDRARKLQRTRDLGSSAPNSETDEGSSSMYSEDLLDSEVGDETEFSMIDNDEEEAMRKIIIAEYRNLMMNAEQEGVWLGADEVEWLSEEIRKEDERIQNGEMEPPPDMEDEDEMLCDMYEHAQSQARDFSAMMNESGLDCQDDEDFSWVNDVDLTLDDQDSMQN